MVKKPRKLISKRLMLLILIVVFLGFGLWIDIVRTNSTQAIQIVNKMRKLNSVGVREPASIPSAEQVQSKFVENANIGIYELDCSMINKKHIVNEFTQLRISGSCLKKIRKITNMSNGYTATIFNIENSVTTDFLTLNKGINKLNLEATDGASGNILLVIEISVE